MFNWVGIHHETVHIRVEKYVYNTEPNYKNVWAFAIWNQTSNCQNYAHLRFDESQAEAIKQLTV